MAEHLLAVLVIAIFMSIPLAAILCAHRRRMAEIELRHRQPGDEALRQQVNALQQQVAALRDTTTSYDLSFDTALQRVERRLSAVERNGAHAPDEQPSRRAL
ncbi:MAG: hypothetical protein IT208_01825 [Chthonomonadales bacterium]|nr:hypothetical protein [Chthonomonadales bacterium]